MKQRDRQITPDTEDYKRILNNESSERLHRECIYFYILYSETHYPGKRTLATRCFFTKTAEFGNEHLMNIERVD